MVCRITRHAPRDATDMERMLELGLELKGPLAVRFPRDNAPGTERIHKDERREMAPGKAKVLVEGEGVVLWAYGALVTQALGENWDAIEGRR